MTDVLTFPKHEIDLTDRGGGANEIEIDVPMMVECSIKSGKNQCYAVSRASIATHLQDLPIDWICAVAYWRSPSSLALDAWNPKNSSFDMYHCLGCR
jgi:hypothetical protein